MVAAAGGPPAPRTAATRAALLKGKSIRVLAVRSLGLAAMFAFEVTLARSLGVAGYGAFAFALAIAAVTSRLAPLGWLNASTKLVAAHVAAARFDLLKGSILLAHGATAVGLALALGVAMITGFGPGGGSGSPALRWLVPIATALALLELHRYVLRGFGAGDLGEALLVLLLPGLAAAAVWALGIHTPAAAAAAYAAVCLLLLCVSTASIASILPRAAWRSRAEVHFRPWTLAAFAMLLGGASDELTARTAVLILGAMGHDEEVGLYQAAARLALMNVFILRVLTPIAAPRISALYHQGRFPELRRAFLRLCALSLAGALPFFLLFAFVPQAVLGWFGPQFVASDNVLRVLSIGYLASAAAGPCATGLMMIGRERIYAVLAFANFALSAAITYLLARQFGALGAAAATAFALVLNNAVYAAIFLRATNGAPVRTDAVPVR